MGESAGKGLLYVGERFNLPVPPSISNRHFHRYRDDIRKSSSRSMTLAQRRPRLSVSSTPTTRSPLRNAATLPPEAPSRPFDVVTMHFCVHYAFETESAVHEIDNVAQYLRRGGRFIGTIPNPDFLMYVRSIPGIPASPSMLADVAAWQRRTAKDTRRRATRVWEQRLSHQFRYPASDRRGFLWPPTISTSSWTRWRMCPSLSSTGPISSRTSPWPNLRLISAYRPWIHSIAKQHNLRLLYKRDFHHIYLEDSENPEYGPLLRRMKVVNEREESAMDEDQWDAAGASTPSLPPSFRGCLESCLTRILYAGVYLAFAFERF